MKKSTTFTSLSGQKFISNSSDITYIVTRDEEAEATMFYKEKGTPMQPIEITRTLFNMGIVNKKVSFCN